MVGELDIRATKSHGSLVNEREYILFVGGKMVEVLVRHSERNCSRNLQPLRDLLALT